MSKADGNISILLIVRYPAQTAIFGFLSMAFFRFPLFFNRRLGFWRLMGSGRNGTFDIKPDLRQWALLAVLKTQDANSVLAGLPTETNGLHPAIGAFITGWIRLFGASVHGFILQPVEGHGLWNGKPVFGQLPRNADSDGEIAVMTRATIRLSRLRQFWKHVDSVATQMANAPGFIKSYGIGEIPFIKQATFSIWENRDAMKQFAYQMQEHKEVILKTRKEKWYSEDMFMRFKILRRL